MLPARLDPGQASVLRDQAPVTYGLATLISGELRLEDDGCLRWRAGGDVAAVLTNDDDGQRLVRYLASVRAARLWARAAGISPNRRLNPNVYPDALTRQLAQSLVNAKAIRFDLSDLQPPAFGAMPGQGMTRRP